jgi:hypothetical protein
VRHLLVLGTVTSCPDRHAKAGSRVIATIVARVPGLSEVAGLLPGAK